MNFFTPNDRDLNVLGSIVTYRAVARRPSQIYVNVMMVAASTGSAPSRLSDLVYWQTEAASGDQIQDSPTGLLLITEAGERYRIRLSEPRARTVETAFTQTALDIAADRRVIAGLLEEQVLVEGRRRAQQKKGAAAPRIAMLPEGHPLIVHERRPGFAEDSRTENAPIMRESVMPGGSALPAASAATQNAYDAAVSEGWSTVVTQSRSRSSHKPKTMRRRNAASTRSVGETG